MADVEQNSQQTAKIIYLLLLTNIVIWFLGVIGVIVAYVNKDDVPQWLQSHYQFQIRTFWIGLLMIFIGGLLVKLGIGLLILAFWVLWVIIRCVKGMKYLDKNQPHPNPNTWLFS